MNEEPLLPGHRHVPGVNSRPQDGAFDAFRQAAAKPTCEATAGANIAWRYGLRLFNAGFDWEAHEVLEAVWLNAAPNSRERALVQGIIHLANGRLKQAMGRPNARRRLAGFAGEAFRAAFPSGGGRLLGIDGEKAASAARDLADGAEMRRLECSYEL